MFSKKYHMQIIRIILEGVFLYIVLDIIYFIMTGSHIGAVNKIINAILFTAVVAIVVTAFYFYISYRDKINKKIELLTSAIFDIIKQVENCSASGYRAAVKADADLMARFSIEGPERIVGASKLIATYDGLNPTPTLVQAGDKLTEFQKARRTAFLQERKFIRSGVSSIYSLLEMKNFNTAYRDMAHYMVSQAKKSDGSMPNFPYLKMFFDLPDTWPNESDAAEAMKKNLSKWDEFIISRVLRSGRRKIENSLTFHLAVPAGTSDVHISGKATMDAFRKFLHASIEELYDSSTGGFR